MAIALDRMEFLFWRPPCLRRRVIINVTYNQTDAIRGVLWSARGGWLTLRDATGLTSGHEPTPIDGDVVIHQSKVAYFQVLQP